LVKFRASASVAFDTLPVEIKSMGDVSHETKVKELHKDLGKNKRILVVFEIEQVFWQAYAVNHNRFRVKGACLDHVVIDNFVVFGEVAAV